MPQDMDGKATVRMVFPETQPFKGVKNYFTILYSTKRLVK